MCFSRMGFGQMFFMLKFLVFERCSDFVRFLLNYRRTFSPMKNPGRFHPRFGLLFLFKMMWDRPGGFCILQKAPLFGLCGFCYGHWLGGFRCMARWLCFLVVLVIVFGQGLTRKHHGTSGKCRWIQGIFRG